MNTYNLQKDIDNTLVYLDRRVNRMVEEAQARIYRPTPTEISELVNHYMEELPKAVAKLSAAFKSMTYELGKTWIGFSDSLPDLDEEDD